MRISMIVAAAKNGVIGHDGDIPWRLPEDQRFFRRMTLGHALIFGRKTFDSIGRALPGRTNLVLTRRAAPEVEDVHFFPGLDAALDWARAQGFDECFIGGGEALYREGLTIADRIYLTRVDATPEGDTRFPELDAEAWTCVERAAHAADERHDHDFVIETWDRKQ